MNLTTWFGRLLNLDNVGSIDDWHVSFGAPWAHHAPAWVVFGCIACGVVAGLFYFRYQTRGARGVKVLLAASRALLLCLLIVILGDPIAVIKYTNTPSPWLWVLFDGTDSMGIEDEYPPADRARLSQSVGLPADTGTAPQHSPAEKLSRQRYVDALLRKTDHNLFRELSQRFRLKAYLFDRPDGVRELDSSAVSGQPPDPERWAEQLTTSGQVTALGEAFEDLALRHGGGNVAGVLAFSDFDQNSGPPPLAAARKLGVPVFTVGVGSEAALDLAVDLHAPLLLKKAERATLTVVVRQTGLNGRPASITLAARRLGGSSLTGSEPIVIGQKTVSLKENDQPIEFPFTPQDTGRFVISAEVAPQPGELVSQNNHAEREVNIQDDFLRLMFVEYEPTWEWRFIKEVFHRDKLVGARGFRTFLRSADPAVRKSNDLFLSTLTPRRSDFFATDVIFLGDMPAATLSTRFCEMTKEFVGKFGGGLVVIAGPRFGPGQLANTPLADMLPVVVDPAARLRDHASFPLRLTPEALQVDFMQLGGSEAENSLAWNNIGRLPWYQPVARLHPLASALAVHPHDTVADGKSPQPLVAIRRFGRGEVVYVGFNETWRLRRKYGEQYYRQFWGQMIHRLGLSHALGSQKRFVVRTDRQQYQPDDKVVLTVEACDANFEPLSEEELPHHQLSGEITLPGAAADGGKTVVSLGIPQFREGVFEARIPVVQAGDHRVTVLDPITNERVEVSFQVTNVSVERRSAVRNVSLEREIAAATGGRAYDLATVAAFANDFHPVQKAESSVQVRPLWSSWFCFGLVVMLMLGEWLIRKLVNLP